VFAGHIITVAAYTGWPKRVSHYQDSSLNPGL